MEQVVEKKVHRKINFSAFGNVVAFFTLEVLAFIAFSLGTSYILYSVLSLVLLVFLLLVTWKQINKDGLATYAFFLFPVLVYGLLSALSSFTWDPLFSLHGLSFFIPFGMTCFAACGFLASSLKTFKISQALLVIYSAIAVLTLINLLATMIEFTPFYTLIYRGKYIYYDGNISEVSVSGMAFALMGFSVSEVSVEYFSLFPSLLLSAVIPLFFIKFKENKSVFSLYLVYFLLGVISLILTVSKVTLITDFLVAVVVLFVLLFAKLNWKGKVLKIVFIVFLCLFIVGFALVFCNAQTDVSAFKWLQNIIANNALLDRLFNSNRFISKYNAILYDVISNDKFFGFYHFAEMTEGYLNGLYPSSSWIFDNFMTSGVFGVVFFAFFLVIGIRRLLKYYRESSDGKMEKALLVCFIFSFLAYSLISYDATPYIFSKEMSPIYLSGPFLVVLFLLSYAFYKSLEKKVEAIQPVEQKEIPVDKQEGGPQNETISL